MDRLGALRYFLLDMDGTVYLGPHAIDGAPEFLAYLKATGRKPLYFTNNPTKDAAAYAEKLRGLGMDAAPEEILTSGEATARYIAGETPWRRLYVLGNPSFEAELARHGLSVVQDAPDAVVLAFDTTLTYEKLRRAGLYLNAGLPYVATNPDAVCPTEYGSIPDCGSMAALLEKATGRTPIFVGKPNPIMAAMGLKKLGAAAAETAMVGDRLYTDMEMARQAGLCGILVLSGEATREQAAAAAHPPEIVVESVKELHARLRAADGAA
ncbi:MAG: HAD-IIA family hydrolase [Candidatus Hydrogenedentes bacterium]|nr:HAD-IIA family hydrolase [Candidatus Hydrogenedentota bacterium]